MDGIKSAGQVAEDYISGCEAKVKCPFSKLFLKAVLAGAMIALGASSDVCSSDLRSFPGWPYDDCFDWR